MNKQNRIDFVDDEISLLDLVVDIAENARLLVLGPIVAAAMAFGVTFLLPNMYTSTAYLELNSADAAVARELVRLPVVLDAIASRFLASGESVEAKRRELLRRITWTEAKGTSDKVIVTLQVEDQKPETAQSISAALIDSWMAKTKPRPDEEARLTAEMQRIENQLQTTDKLIRRLAEQPLVVPGMMTELASPQAALQTRNAELTTRKAEIERYLQGVSRDAILFAPDLPAERSAPQRGSIAVYTALAVEAVLLIFAFAAGAVRRMERNPQTAVKFTLIRRAFLWRQRSDKS